MIIFLKCLQFSPLPLHSSFFSGMIILYILDILHPFSFPFDFVYFSQSLLYFWLTFQCSASCVFSFPFASMIWFPFSLPFLRQFSEITFHIFLFPHYICFLSVFGDFVLMSIQNSICNSIEFKNSHFQIQYKKTTQMENLLVFLD